MIDPVDASDDANAVQQVHEFVEYLERSLSVELLEFEDGKLESGPLEDIQRFYASATPEDMRDMQGAFVDLRQFRGEKTDFYISELSGCIHHHEQLPEASNQVTILG